VRNNFDFDDEENEKREKREKKIFFKTLFFC